VAHRRFEALRPTFTPEWLNTLLTLRAIGRTFTLPRWAILRHIVNHSSYHRGQIFSAESARSSPEEVRDRLFDPERLSLEAI